MSQLPQMRGREEQYSLSLSGGKREAEPLPYEEVKKTRTESYPENTPIISMYALTGALAASQYDTMTLSGQYKDYNLHMLVDSSSTHNFLDESVAKKFKLHLQKVLPMVIGVAGGHQLMCDTILSRV